MNVLLSIKPEFADKILERVKRYEFRKTRFRDPSDIETIYMYASSPVQRIVGAFSLGDVIEDTPANLWRRYGTDSGIGQRSRFMEYFAEAEKGYAFEVEEPHRLPNPVNPWRYRDDFSPPVSFQYIGTDDEFVSDHLRAPPGSD